MDYLIKLINSSIFYWTLMILIMHLTQFTKYDTVFQIYYMSFTLFSCFCN